MKFLFFASLFLLANSVLAKKDDEFAGMRVLCVACSSGIGRSAAEILLKGGAQVVVSSRTQSKCDDVVKPYKNGYAVAGDAGKTEDMKQLVEKSRKLMGGPVSHFVYAATDMGIAPFTTEDTEALLETFRTQNEINIVGYVRLFQLLKQDLMETKGAVVSVSSVAGHNPLTGGPAYSTSKAAQRLLVRSMALEVGRDGVRINSVSPAVIETPIFDFLGDAKEAFLKSLDWRHLAGRIGQPDEVGHMIAFLLSDKAGFINGQDIIVDGGASVMGSLADMYSGLLIEAEHRRDGHFLYSDYHAGKESAGKTEL